MFKFLHSADIHLDSPLQGLEKYEGAPPVEQIRQATRRAFENLVRLAIDEKVSFVLIAGDLYDQNWKDYNTGLYFVKQMTKLREARIPVYIIKGNHDAENQITRHLRLPDNAKMLPTDQPDTYILEDISVAIHGQSYAKRAVTDDLSARYPPMKRGFFNIGMLHTCAGCGGHADYAPCTIDGLRSKDYDYWALGHVHKRQFRHEDPPIVFPGNVQGRKIDEQGPKGCMLVTVADGRRTEVEFRCLDVLRWESCAVDACETYDAEDIVERAADGLAALRQESAGRPLAVRVKIGGSCSVHEQLLANPQRWTNEIRSRAIEIGVGEIWIEQVKFCTSAPGTPAQLGEGPISELLGVLEQLRTDDGQLQSLRAELADLDRRLPGDLKEGPDALKLNDSEWLRGVLEQVQPLLVNLLLSRENAR